MKKIGFENCPKPMTDLYVIFGDLFQLSRYIVCNVLCLSIDDRTR